MQQQQTFQNSNATRAFEIPQSESHQARRFLNRGNRETGVVPKRQMFSTFAAYKSREEVKGGQKVSGQRCVGMPLEVPVLIVSNFFLFGRCR